MRFGGPIFEQFTDPQSWAQAVQSKGYRAAYCPLSIEEHPVSTISAYAAAADQADIVIAEVGTWCNPLSPDEKIRSAALERCKIGLWLADEIGARCCVNIAGSRGEKWDGPCALDLTAETYEMIVASVREIIDAVQPKRSDYTLEGMPWMFPDSPQSYLQLLRDIDRPHFAAHLDPVNWINSPQRYFKNTALLEESFRLLGPHIRSIHAKDILLEEHLTVHLPEVRIGLGGLDYRTFLRLANQLNPDTTFMLEHLPCEEEYDLAANHVRNTADALSIPL